MPEYKLTYLDIGAVGEPIRLLLHAANVPFEDVRIELAEWPNHKAKFPLGQVPQLEIDGKPMTQSLAILAYLAKKHGFVTKDDFLNFRVDQIVQLVEDARLLVRPFLVEMLQGNKDLETVVKLRTSLKEKDIPLHLKQAESIVSETEGSFIAGDQITHGDFVLFNWVDIWERVIDEHLLDNFPALKRHQEAVKYLPGVREWLEARPKTLI